MATLTTLIVSNPIAAVVIAAVAGFLLRNINPDSLPDWLKNFIPGLKTKAQKANADMKATIDGEAAKIKTKLESLGIFQSLENVRRFVECSVALAGIDGLKKIVDDVTPADRLPTVDACFDTLHTEVANALANPPKPAPVA